MDQTNRYVESFLLYHTCARLCCPEGMDILPFSLCMDVNSVFFTARLQSHSWFRMEFGFIDEVTFSNGARYRYIGLHVPELYSYYSGNYSAVYSHASFYPVI